jgi:ResB-like family.
VHIGLIILLAGTLIDSYFGIRGIMQVPEGEKSNLLMSLNLASNKVYKLLFMCMKKGLR